LKIDCSPTVEKPVAEKLKIRNCYFARRRLGKPEANFLVSAAGLWPAGV